VIPEIFVIAHEAIEESELSCIVAAISAVVEIVVILAGAEWQQLKRGPAEHVATVPVVGIPHS
jgi:hypothetical protein